MILGGKGRGDREEQNPSINWKRSDRIWPESTRESGARVRRGRGGRPEVEDNPDRWAPPVSGWERGGAGAAAWADLGRAREGERKGEMGRKRPKDQEGGDFELF